MIFLDKMPLCSFSDGAFQGTNRKPKLLPLQEALQKWPLTQGHCYKLLNGITRIVTAAGEERYGCAIVIDPSKPPLHLPGQALATPMNLDHNANMSLAAALAKLDGALHIDSNLQLRTFACLMDGPSLPQEDRARGARYNSALRFTAMHPGLLVVVVSSDRPVSVIQNGVDLSRNPVWPAISNTLRIPQTLGHWLES